jgi:glycosyltransferase involved in cell wall biosynthesis
MRIMQLIDTLRPGGAERMALNYFLALDKRGFKSYIVVSREEGLLAEQIRNNPAYNFLKKSSTLDFSAFFKLKKIIAENNIDIIQAHGSSWFWAVLCKISGSKIKVVWHDHYGDSENLDKRNSTPIIRFSKYFDGIISVNNNLRNWAEHFLKYKKPLIYIPNFVNHSSGKSLELLGDHSLKLVCVANLRPQKDHITLIKAFQHIQNNYDVSLHLLGRNFRDEYYSSVKKMFVKNPAIFYYGEVNSVVDFLPDADFGILSSKSEGMPLALLEYGVSGLPVICTNVGECSSLIGADGLLVEANNTDSLAKAIQLYIENPAKAKRDSINFRRRIEKDFSESAILMKFQEFINKI